MELIHYFNSISKISNDTSLELEKISRIMNFPKNSIIQNIGSSCRTIYFIQSGCARIFYDKDGIDITEHFAFKNELIVRAESLFTGQPTSKGIQAIDETFVWAIDSLKLFSLYDSHHDLERLFRILFEREYVITTRRIESLQFKSAKERYLELLESTNYVQTIPLKYIATYLGITQVSLSRIRSEIT
jgi:CRP-like cAMP-binding protein